jgi:hypothetical protein
MAACAVGLDAILRLELRLTAVLAEISFVCRDPGFQRQAAGVVHEKKAGGRSQSSLLSSSKLARTVKTLGTLATR